MHGARRRPRRRLGIHSLFCAAVLLILPAIALAGKQGPVVLLPSQEMPTVAFRILFAAGSADDPPGQEGLCALSARTLAHGGTQSHSHEGVVEELYPLAGGIDVQVDKDYTVFTGLVHREALAAFYPLFRDILIAPRWDRADFDREKQAALNYVREDLVAGNDEALGKAALESFLYGDGPYGHPIRGTVAGLESIDLDAARGFAKKHFVRSRMLVGLAGAYPEGFAATLLADLESLPEGKANRPAPAAPPEFQGIQLLLVEKSAPATAVSLGFPVTVDRRQADYWPLFAAGNRFGEHRTFFGRLMNSMRVKRGLNYGDYAYIEAFRQAPRSKLPLPNIQRRQQFFSIWIRPVEPVNGHFALRQALRELRILVEDGLGEQELDDTRQHLENASQLWSMGLQRRLGMAMDDALIGTGDYVKRLQEELTTMTSAGVNRVIAAHLQWQNVKVAMVCDDAAALAAAIRDNAISPIAYGTDTTPADVLAEDAIIEGYPLAVTRVEIVSADELFAYKRSW